MKVKIKKQGGLAIDCRTNVYFEVDDVFAIGDERFSKENLTRLIELGYADEVADKIAKEIVEENFYSDDDLDCDEDLEFEEEVLTEEPKPEYMSFTKKADLDQYAKETYNIDLDRRLTLKKMIEQLENELGGEL